MSLLRTPLYDWHVAHGGRIVPFAGWEMPVQYTGVIPEHKAVRTRAGLFDVSHMARLTFTGPDALPLVEHLFTNAVASMKEGQVRYGLICNADGGTLDDVLVYRWPDHLSMVVNASNRETILNWIDPHARGMNLKVADHTEDTAMLALQGPASQELVHGLFADDVAPLKFYYARPTQYQGHACVVSRTGYTGEDGFEVIVNKEQAVNVWQTLVDRGALACGLGARDTLRLEAGMPLYGHELSTAINPIQAGLGWAVKLDKGEFIGREALRQASVPHPEKPVRVGLKLSGNRAARAGAKVVDPQGQTLGEVTSGSYTPWLEASLAMAYIRGDHAAAQTPVAIDIRGSTIPATVVPLPFYKRAR